MDFAQKLKILRNKKGLTQTELGKFFNLSKQTISSYENGGSSPDKEMLQLLADFFNVSTDYLLGRTDDPRTAEKIIADAAGPDAELAQFWDKLSQRDDLQLMFKQVKDMSPDDIRKIIRIIKVIEDEEAASDDW